MHIILLLLQRAVKIWARKSLISILLHIRVKLHTVVLKYYIAKLAVANRMERKPSKTRHTHWNLDIDELIGRNWEPHIVSIAAVGLLLVPCDIKVLGKSLLIDVHKYWHIYEHWWTVSISTVDRSIDQELGGSVWDYVCNAELMELWIIQPFMSNTSVNRHPNYKKSSGVRQKS